jgi:DNA polymerase I-like protein with 3'-5' exonuclease and polymerase domains
LVHGVTLTGVGHAPSPRTGENAMGADYRYYGPDDVKPPVSRLEGCSILAVDVETYTAGDPIPVGVGICGNTTEAFYFSLLPASEDIPWHLLRDPSITKLMHGAPFDLRVLREWDIDTTNVIDTAIMTRMNAISPATLEDACNVMETKYRPRHMKDVWLENGVDNSIDLGEDVNAVKCCTDVLGTWELYHKLLPTTDMEYVQREMRLMPILEAMSSRGIKIDQDVRLGLEYAYKAEMDNLDSICQEHFGLNPWSPTQVAYILTKRGNFLPTKRGKTGRWSATTDEATLEKILHVEPLAGLVLRARHARKMYGTYIIPYREQDRAYTYFHLEASTARISSSSWAKYERNLQNIPGDKVAGGSVSMRNMFVPDSGWFTDTDFSQIELRELAYISNDRVMQDILNDPNGDIHQETANFLGVPRWMAKNCTFAIVYGATAQTVMETAHFQDIRRAQSVLDAIFRKYRSMGDWIRSTQEFGRYHDYVVTKSGRKISVLGPDSTILETDNQRQIESKLKNKDRKSTNYPIQCGAGEDMKNALLIAWTEANMVPMAHQVHDEIIWDGNFSTPEEIDQMFNGRVAPFPTPTNTKYIERWQ